MKSIVFCSNCQSHRWPLKKAGFCVKCYYWQRKKSILQRELNSISSVRSLRATTLRVEIRMTEKILQEYRLREEHLNKEDVNALAIESLVYAVASECRSEIGLLAQPLHSLLKGQTLGARKLMFSIFLSIVENIPSKYPRLGTLTPPKRGKYSIHI